jgi:glycosyltransferase involved in cell wall biosynthesis
MRKSYVIISPVRSEEKYIEKTILAVISQTILPAEWIIVNDGSTDDTVKIISSYLTKYPWIRCIHLEPHGYLPGEGVVNAFYQGFKEVSFREWEYIVKLDGDLIIGANYFETLLNEFERNPNLGIASGRIWKEPSTKDHAIGASKVYRRDCFNAIGGLERTLGWDTIDELKAQVLNWDTISFKNLEIVHLRKMGFRNTDWSKGRFRNGKCQWFLGYHPLYAVLKGFYRMMEKPFIIGGFAMILGYFTSMIKNEPRYNNKEVLEYQKRKQLAKFSGLTINHVIQRAARFAL